MNHLGSDTLSPIIKSLPRSIIIVYYDGIDQRSQIILVT